MRLSEKEVAVIAGDRPRAPLRGDIWRASNGWERHVLAISPHDVSYIQVAEGRPNIHRRCLHVVWDRWARKSGASFVGLHGGAPAARLRET